MKITIIGHSTVLIEAEGQKILTDPWFGTWGNPAYGRLAPPAMRREELHNVNLVLVSHNHFDHVDTRFLRGKAEGTPVLAPRLSGWMIGLYGVRNLVGMKTWEERRFGNIAVTAVPAIHVAVTTGFVIRAEGKAVYFAGDTFYGAFMRDIGQRFRIDVALMPVTTYLIPMTMGEQGAVRAAQDLNPGIVIPIHLGLQPRSPLLRTDHTPEGFARRLHAAGSRTTVTILQDGESSTI